MAVERSKKVSWCVYVGFHILLIGLLFVSLEKTIFIPADPAPPTQQPIIDAVMVTPKALQQEKARLKAIEQQKREREQQREEALAQKEKDAQEKTAQEEARLAELKQKTEQLKKEAEQQKLRQQKEVEEQQAALKKIQKQKEAALAEKKKIEAERKAAAEKKLAEIAKAEPPAETKADTQAEKEEPTPPPSASVKVKQDAITHYAMLMRNKIHQNWRQPIGLDIAGFKCKVAVKLMPTGEVLDAQVVQSSGSLEFDRSTELAVRKASPLPVPEDPEIAKEFRQFTFTFHPEAA